MFYSKQYLHYRLLEVCGGKEVDDIDKYLDYGVHASFLPLNENHGLKLFLHDEYIYDKERAENHPQLVKHQHVRMNFEAQKQGHELGICPKPHYMDMGLKFGPYTYNYLITEIAHPFSKTHTVQEFLDWKSFYRKQWERFIEKCIQIKRTDCHIENVALKNGRLLLIDVSV